MFRTAIPSSLAPGITVVVCSYNGAAVLPGTLAALAEQRTGHLPGWEVIVVDNASTDSTPAVIAQHVQHHSHLPFRSVREGNPGKSNALSAGIAQARYAYLLICDDDNRLEPDYLQVAYSIMEEHPEVAVCGGQGTLQTDGTVPAWFPRFQHYYAVGPQAPATGYVPAKPGVLWGAGMVIRLSAVAQLFALGWVPKLEGPKKGSKFTTGEDSELCFMLRMAGHQLWFDQSLRYGHFQRADRLTWDYCAHLSASFGQSQAINRAYLCVLSGNYPPKISGFWRGELSWLLKAWWKNRKLLKEKPEDEPRYLTAIFLLYYLKGVWRLRSDFDQHARHVFLLARKLGHSLPAGLILDH